jgi:hypothetical protein
MLYSHKYGTAVGEGDSTSSGTVFTTSTWPLYSIYSYEKHSERNYGDYDRNRAVFFTITAYPCTWHSPSKNFMKMEKKQKPVPLPFLWDMKLHE